MPYERGGDMREHDDGARAGWVIAFVLILALLTLGFFAYRYDWLGVNDRPETEIRIEQPAPTPPEGGDAQPEPPTGETQVPAEDATTTQPTTTP